MDIEATLNVVGLPGVRSAAHRDATLLSGVLEEIRDDGTLIVSTEVGQRLICEWLETGDRMQISLNVGDRMMVATVTNGGPGVAIGRIGRYCAPAACDPVKQLRLQATESVLLTCGQSSLEMRADGKVMIRGEDVLVRAKGTQRIRAGTVSIN